MIQATKVDCKGCHEENGKVVVPQCMRCHEIDKLHAFNKIGKLTSRSGLKCAVCHPDESKLSATTLAAATAVQTSEGTVRPQSAEKSPGFEITLAAGIILEECMPIRRWR